MRGASPRLGAFVLLAMLGLAQGAPPLSADALPHDAYVWNRLWTPAVERALVQSSAGIRQWRVLGAEMSGNGELVGIRADRTALLRVAKPVVLVVRINGQIPRWNHAAVVRSVVTLVEEWRATGIDVAGVEIDHDCATARLAAYGEFLGRLRQAQPASVRISITALPAWLDSPRLGAVLGRVDEAVLQVHAVVNPRQGLFDRAQAAGWVRRWARVSTVPFRVALPTYGSRVTWNAAGKLTSVESEVPRFANLADGTELVVRPLDVVSLVEELERLRLPLLAGFVWFRLPTDQDRRAWTPSTWQAVIARRARPSPVDVDVIASDAAGTFDVYVTNRGPVDELYPATIDIGASERCETGDALTPYAVRWSRQRITFQAVTPLLVAARERRLVGWVRCTREGGSTHAAH